MKKYISIALVLCLIAGFSGLLIAGVNLMTESVISENKRKIEDDACKQIYESASFEEISETFNNDSISKKWEASENEQTIGYIYKVAGKNAYGTIEALVGINIDGTIKTVILTANTQSFAKIVNDHVQGNYSNLTSLDGIDVTCGATYGAKLVKNLVQAALNDYREDLG